MADPLVFDMPMELGLELMAIVGSDFLDAERELFDDAVDEVDGAGLGMFLVDLERPHPCRIIDGGELEATDLLALFSSERQELDVHLDVVTRNLFVVAFGMDLAQPGSTRKPVDAMALEYPGNCGI